MKQTYDSNSDLTTYIQSSDLASITKQNYIDHIRFLERTLNKSMFDIIKDAPSSIKKMVDISKTDTSLKSRYSIVLSLFRYVPKLKEQLESANKQWFEAFSNADQVVIDRYKKNEPTDRQQKGYVEYSKIIEKRDTLQKGSVERLLLGMYTYIYPLRSDFNAVRLYKVVPSKPAANYIHMAKNSCKLVLTEYKTASTHGAFEKILPSALCEEIALSLEKRPRDYLFVKPDGYEFDIARSFNKYANRILAKLFGVPLTISLIRHSFIMTLDFNTLTIAEKERIASEMRHTIKIQDQYRLIFQNGKA